jgi:AAA15 family ATPase/GTPase
VTTDAQVLMKAEVVPVTEESKGFSSIIVISSVVSLVLLVGLFLKNTISKKRFIENNIQERLIDNFVRV